MERTLSNDGAQGPSRSRRTTCAAAAGCGCTCGSGETRRARRSCSSTAGRKATCAGRNRSGLARRGVPARHLRPPRPRPVGHRWTRGATRRAAVGGRRRRGDRAIGLWTGRCWSDGPTAGSRRTTTSRRTARGRSQGSTWWRRGAPHPASTTSERGSSTTRRAPAGPTSPPASRPSSASSAPARMPGPLSDSRTGARRCAGTWSSRPR